MKHVLFHSLSNYLQPRQRIGVAIGEYVLDVSAVAPLFFTGPTLGPQQQVRHHTRLGGTYWGHWGRSMSLSGRNILGTLGEVNESVGEEHIGDIGGGQ